MSVSSITLHKASYDERTNLGAVHSTSFDAHKLKSLFSRVITFLSILFMAFSVSASNSRSSMPAELYEGMVKFKLNSGDYFNALTMMDQRYIDENPVDYISALYGYSIFTESKALLAGGKGKLDPKERFLIGEVYYNDGDCINALKSLKGLKKKISLEDKQKWIFYRADCFMRLGSPERAAKALKEIIDGMWASYAYYNLAISYAETSHDKTKALGTLWIANSLNKGKSKEAYALSDRINLASGALYLEGGKPDLALEFFKKIYLDSHSSTKGLYLNGLAHLELGDFRAATQSWVSTKTYPVIIESVAEAALAIPYAYERSGYISQALEAYLEASSGFEKELRTIDKLDKALKKHGARKVLIDGSEIKGLEWFLAKGVVKNTTRAAYYSHFVAKQDIHDVVKLFSEMRALLASIEYWQSQLAVYDTSLNTKKASFNSNRKSFKSDAINSEIGRYKTQIQQLAANKLVSPDVRKSIKLDAMFGAVSTLEKRLKTLKATVDNGKDRLDTQLAESIKLRERLDNEQVRLESILVKLDAEITSKCRASLEQLKNQTQANYERAEQGLIHIFQSIAERKKAKNRKYNDRRAPK